MGLGQISGFQVVFGFDLLRVLLGMKFKQIGTKISWFGWEMKDLSWEDRVLRLKSFWSNNLNIVSCDF